MTIAKRSVLLLAVPLLGLVALGILTRVQLATIKERTQFVAEIAGGVFFRRRGFSILLGRCLENTPGPDFHMPAGTDRRTSENDSSEAEESFAVASSC